MSDTVVLTAPRFRDSQRLQRAANNSPALRPPEQSDAVKRLQQSLVEIGFSMPISLRSGAPDGIYGAETRAVVRQFQERRGLRPDGIVGRETLSLLDKLFADEIRPHTPVIPPSCPTVEGPAAATFAAYIDLVDCAAKTRGLTTRDTLALLRQATVARSGDPILDQGFWADTILSPRFENFVELTDDPAVAIVSKSTPVADAQGSRIVSTLHLLAGLEAMCAPSAEVELGRARGATAILRAPSEAVATWLHYLVLIALRKALDDTRADAPGDWSGYFASDNPVHTAPLEGAVDAYAIRHGLSGIDCEETTVNYSRQVGIFPV